MLKNIIDRKCEHDLVTKDTARSPSNPERLIYSCLKEKFSINKYFLFFTLFSCFKNFTLLSIDKSLRSITTKCLTYDKQTRKKLKVLFFN